MVGASLKLQTSKSMTGQSCFSKSTVALDLRLHGIDRQIAISFLEYFFGKVYSSP